MSPQVQDGIGVAREIGRYQRVNVLVGHQGDREKSIEELERDVAAALEPFTLRSIALRTAQMTALRAKDRAEFERQLREAGANPIGTLRPAFLRRMVTKAIRDRELPDHAAREMRIVDLALAERTVVDLTNAQDAEQLSDGEADSVISAMQRMYQSQYRDQLHWGYFLRELALILRAIDEAQAQHLIDLDRAWYEKHGLTFRDFAFLSFGFLSQAAAHPGVVFGPGQPDLGARIHIAPNQVEAFRRLCASSYQQFQERANHPAVRFEDHPLYSLSPLVMWPLVDVGDDELVLPIATDVIDRAIYALPFDVRSLLSTSDAERFLGCYHRTIERYVGESLTRGGAFDRVLSGDKVVAEGQRCDWVGVYRRNALLVEVKSGLLSIQAEVTRDMGALREVLAKDHGVADGLIQISATARAIRGGETELDPRTNLIGLIVLAGDAVMMNDRRIRAMIDDIIRQKTGAGPAVQFQVANSYDFSELVSSCRAHGSMWNFLSGKVQSPHSRDIELSLAVGEGQGVHPLRDEMSKTFDELFVQYGFDRRDLEEPS